MKVLYCITLLAATAPHRTFLIRQSVSQGNQVESGTSITIELDATNDTRQTLEARAKQFIWTHFNGHTAGYLKVNRYSKEGELSVSEYRINQAATGSWRVDVEIRRHLRDRQSGKITRSKVAYSAVGLRLIPSDHAVSPDLGFFKTHQLQMLDANGNVLSSI